MEEIRQSQETNRYSFFETRVFKPLIVVLGIISMVGGLAATGVLFSSMGAVAFSFVCAGFILGVILIAIGVSTQQHPQEEELEDRRATLVINDVIHQTFAQTRALMFEGRHQFGMSDFTIIGQALEGGIPDILVNRRAQGVMLGMVVGDSIGIRYKGLPFRYNLYSENYVREHLQWQKGQWSGLSAQTLTLGDVLIKEDLVLNETQLMWSFYDWWKHGYNSSFTRGEYYLPAADLPEDMEAPL